MNTKRMTDAVCRLLIQHQQKPMLEFQLPNGRRLDIACLGANGALLGVEVKLTESDFNRDLKWADAAAHCELFYIAIPVGFNHLLIHPGIRLIHVEGDDARITRRMGLGLVPAHKWQEPVGTFAVKPSLTAAPLRYAPADDNKRRRFWMP